MFERRSIRRYQEKMVEDTKIDRIIRAGMQAPSAVNQRGWEFLVVKNKETLKKLSRMSLYSEMVEGSGAAIIVLGNKKDMTYPQYWEQDLSAATQNILLEAVDQGLGAVWLGVAPEKERMLYIKEVFDLPEGVEVFAVVAMGYPVDENKFVDRFEENKVYYEKYGR